MTKIVTRLVDSSNVLKTSFALVNVIPVLFRFKLFKVMIMYMQYLREICRFQCEVFSMSDKFEGGIHR